MTPENHNCSAVILAGGQARRMGGSDKGLLTLNGKTMIEHVINALKPQCQHIVINANRNLEEYQQYGYPVIPDLDREFNGPLAGMAACMKAINSKFMLTLPCDSPLVARDYASRMLKKQEESDSDICVARNSERIQPVFCMLKCSLLDSMLSYLDSGERKIDRWFQQHHLQEVDFSDSETMFENINTPEELDKMQQELIRESA